MIMIIRNDTTNYGNWTPFILNISSTWSDTMDNTNDIIDEYIDAKDHHYTLTIIIVVFIIIGIIFLYCLLMICVSRCVDGFIKPNSNNKPPQRESIPDMNDNEDKPVAIGMISVDGTIQNSLFNGVNINKESDTESLRKSTLSTIILSTISEKKEEEHDEDIEENMEFMGKGYDIK